MNFNKININFLTLITSYSFLIALIFNWDVFVVLNFNFSLTSVSSLTFKYFFFILIFLVLFFYLFTFLILFGFRSILKFLIIFFLITSSILLYFKNVYGVSVNEGIILSFIDSITEKNYDEINDLLSYKILYYVLIYSILPSLPLCLINVIYPSIKKEIFLRISSLLILLIFILGLIGANYRNVSLTVRVNKELNQRTIPHYYMMSLFNIIKDSFRPKQEFKVLKHETKSKASNSKITGIVVIGETARADFFTLNGYKRNTNPNLSKIDIINYSNAYSCGTLTKVSLPCMFYLSDYKNFSVKKATNETNLLDIISSTKTDVSWLGNNSGCKHVCDRVKTIEMSHQKSILKNEYNEEIECGRCVYFGPYLPTSDHQQIKYDEVLLPYVDQMILESKSRKNLIVLHTAGSHGPKYYKRYPPIFEKFKPSCKSNNPQDCTKKELIHAFENTILYTDYFLSLLIKRLEKLDHQSFMIYASDHGESLGELGLYLHGAPRKFAPKEQIHIPWFMWFSDQYKKNNKLDFIKEDTEITHEYFPHTILKALKIESTLLKENKSLIK